MSRNRRLLLVLAQVCFGSLAANAAAEPKQQMVVSPQWLSDHLKDSSLVILHVGSPEDYQAGHIPGAQLMTLADISVTEHGLRLELPGVDVLQAALRKRGIQTDSRIVVYPAGDSVQSATRVWFTLDYLGLGSQAALLDGGLAGWKRENRPLSQETPTVSPSSLTVRPHPDLVVDAAWVSAHLKDPSVQILDARMPAFYSGENAGDMPRAGHIPGARNIPFPTLFDAQRRLKSPEALQALLQPAGNTAATSVTYCHIGQQATVLYFASRYLDLPVKLYDGSFQDWSQRSDLPVEPAGEKKNP